MDDSIIEITELSSNLLKSLFSQFSELYWRGFPDANEREDVDQWEKRLADRTQASSEPSFHIVIIGDNFGNGERAHVHGGIVFEYYKLSTSGLITYIVIDEGHRRKGLATKLFKRASELLENEANKSGAKLAAIFAEANNPCRTPLSADTMPPATRLEIFAKLGAKWVDIDYVQPSLRKGKDRARNLLLLCLPDSRGTVAIKDNKQIGLFLSEFYASLGAVDHASDKDFQKALLDLNKADFLVDIPLVEQPILDFPDSAICLHAISDGSPGVIEGDVGFQEEDALSSMFRSFELDILSYRYQSAPPLVSKCVTELPLEVDVLYPERIEYETEGRLMTILCPIESRRRTMRAILSTTLFRESQLSVWNLALRPVHGKSFSEYDFIKLTKLYGGIQEGALLTNEIGFLLKDNENERLTIEGLINRLVCSSLGAHVEIGQIRGGTIEIDTSTGKCAEEVRNILDSLRRVFRDDPGSSLNLEHLFKSNALENYILRALCGVVTGIFDFRRMSFPEMLDTFEPTVLRGTAFIRIHRGNLVSLDGEDEILQSCQNTCGMSPYLMIPQAVLIHNDALVDLSESDMKEIDQFEPRGNKRGLPRLVHEWEGIRYSVERHLNLEYIPNIFQYETERQLLDKGAAHRGSVQRAILARNRLEELKHRIDAIRTERVKEAESNTTILVAFLTVLLLQPIIFDFFRDWYAQTQEPGRVWGWGVFIAVSIISGVCLLLIRHKGQLKSAGYRYRTAIRTKHDQELANPSVTNK